MRPSSVHAEQKSTNAHRATNSLRSSSAIASFPQERLAEAGKYLALSKNSVFHKLKSFYRNLETPARSYPQSCPSCLALSNSICPQMA
jgi:hypothetical protein